MMPVYGFPRGWRIINYPSYWGRESPGRLTGRGVDLSEILLPGAWPKISFLRITSSAPFRRLTELNHSPMPGQRTGVHSLARTTGVSCVVAQTELDMECGSGSGSDSIGIAKLNHQGARNEQHFDFSSDQVHAGPFT